MSVTTLAFDVEKGKYVLDLRMFLDDFMVVTQGGSEADYGPNELFQKPSKSSIKKYVAENLRLEVNGSSIPLKVSKIKFEELTIYVAFQMNQVPVPSEIKEIVAEDTIFVDHFANQRNVIHIELPNQRRRSLLFNAHYREASVLLER